MRPYLRTLLFFPLVIASFAAHAACAPLETRAANAPDQRPGHAGQTRACAVKTTPPPKLTVLAKGLAQPWSVEPLPNGDLLISEKPGRLRIVTAAGEVGPPIANVPKVDSAGQGGLLDVALSPAFASDRTVFFSYSEPRQGGGNATSVGRGVLSADGKSLEQFKVIFQALPAISGDGHFGSRLAFGPDGMLYVTTGDRSQHRFRRLAQERDNHMGKVLRIKPDGTAPDDNPFAGRRGAKPEVWSLGHRNPQSLAFDAQGRLWEVEHGTQGGDELNRIEKGKNYGWPVQAYGQEYSGRPIPGATTNPSGFEQPVYYWDPVIAPSGAQFYSGKLFPAWKGNLFVGGLKQKALVRLMLENDRVVGEEHLFADRGHRIRDVREGPDGALYVVTDQGNGELWRITP